jgi:hypothetical protein
VDIACPTVAVIAACGYFKLEGGRVGGVLSDEPPQPELVAEIRTTIRKTTTDGRLSSLAWINLRPSGPRAQTLGTRLTFADLEE